MIKNKKSNIIISNLIKNKNIIEINYNHFIYNYLSCDLTIVFGYSTSYIESLLISDKVILFDDKNDLNFLKEYKSFFICQNICQFSSLNLNNDISEEDKFEFQKKILGSKIDYCTDNIIAIIESHFKKINNCNRINIINSEIDILKNKVEQLYQKDKLKKDMKNDKKNNVNNVKNNMNNVKINNLKSKKIIINKMVTIK